MILTPETQKFIQQHANDNVKQLALKSECAKAKEAGIDVAFALEQIAGRQTARRKLPSWAAIDGLIFPPHISMEQCSSEQTARYKMRIMSEYIKQCGGEDATLIDMTGGFGVDFSFLAQLFPHYIYIERQEHLCDIARHNLPLLGLDNAEVVCGDGEEWIKGDGKERETFVFIDPARRDGNGNRTYAIGDCTPNILSFINDLTRKARMVMIKLSPMLDWHATVADINRMVEGHDAVREVHIVSTGNECKELLIVVSTRNNNDNENKRALRVYCVTPLPNPPHQGEEERPSPPSGHLPRNGEEKIVIEGDEDSPFEIFTFTPSSPSPSSTIYPPPLTGEVPEGRRGSAGGSGRASGRGSALLYIPNPSIMKAGCFDVLEARFGIQQVGRNSHLFISDRKIEGFPGKIYEIKAISSMNKKELRKTLQGIEQANISTRNFPMSPEQLRKRLKLRDGGNIYIFATTTAEGEHILYITQKS